jgi:hypothetical protein
MRKSVATHHAVGFLRPPRPVLEILDPENGYENSPNVRLRPQCPSETDPDPFSFHQSESRCAAVGPAPTPAVGVVAILRIGDS